jgi:FtsP/CotA-like multicopper oxidase with cupredoxin domain
MRRVTTMAHYQLPIPRPRTSLALFVALVLAVALLPQSAGFSPSARAAVSTGANRVGIVCTGDSSTTTPVFNLTTRTGYINLPDGTTAYMWGLSQGSAPFQHPGPVLCVNEGDTVTVILHNTLPVDTSLTFPGQVDVAANGAPAQPQFSGATLRSLTDTAAAGGGSVTYSFTASKPGTFLYESGTDPAIQVRMGLFGALLVRPSDNSPTDLFAYDRPDSQYTADEEFMVLLSEIDPYLNAAVARAVKRNKPITFDMTRYHPRYWLINGRGFPDSIADNFASWLPSQPYGALALIHPMNSQEFLDPPTNAQPNPAYHPYPGLVRYLSVGTEEYPFHPHGNNGKIIARDGNPLESGTGDDLSFEKFSVNIGPGQTWDALFGWADPESYSPITNPIPITEPNIQDLEIGMFFGCSPYLGSTEPMPPSITTLNECGEFYIIAHNHALYQITSWGVNMTGPITYSRIDPPLPNNCPS